MAHHSANRGHLAFCLPAQWHLLTCYAPERAPLTTPLPAPLPMTAYDIARAFYSDRADARAITRASRIPVAHWELYTVHIVEFSFCNNEDYSSERHSAEKYDVNILSFFVNILSELIYVLLHYKIPSGKSYSSFLSPLLAPILFLCPQWISSELTRVSLSLTTIVMLLLAFVYFVASTKS